MPADILRRLEFLHFQDPFRPQRNVEKDHPRQARSPRNSKIVGNHTFKVGGNWNTNDYFGPGPGFGGGADFSALQTADPVNPGDTGSGLASYLLSVPALGRRRGNIEEVRGHRVYGFYFQDTWKVTNRLTLNLGVRNDATIARRSLCNQVQAVL